MPINKHHREILHIAIPSIVSNITVPLLGLIDLSIVGHMFADTSSQHSTAAIGAIAVGGLIFNMVYWVFNFLRMGTSGLTAQAYGRSNSQEQLQVLLQATAVGLCCGLVIFMLQRPIEWFSYRLIAPSAEVWSMAVEYFRIRIVAAPAVLILFALNGWFVGMQNSFFPMVIAIGQNIVNILASLWLVFGFDMSIAGVAWGTVISQYIALIAAVFMWCGRYRYLGRQFVAVWHSALRDVVALRRFFTVNTDIFFRMLCIIAVTSSFTAIGARQGDMLLAVNTLLMQLFTLFSYFIDGFALSGEALTGKYHGACNRGELRRLIKNLFVWCGAVALLFTFIYAAGGPRFLHLLTDDVAVSVAALPYLPWTVAIPLLSFAAFVWDGVYIGLTATRHMLYSLTFSTILFFAVYFLPTYLLPHTCLPDNHRLWLAFLVYLFARSIYQTIAFRAVVFRFAS